MKCPVDDETLLMTQRDGVEIDYCPKCRGVWLDRGELDKIIERSDRADNRDPGAVAADDRLRPSHARPDHDDGYRKHGGHGRHHGGGHGALGRGGFLARLFD